MPSYKSYCWAFGTTSFRMVEFNKKIEMQLSYLSDFWMLNENINEIWLGNNEVQKRYYDFLHSQGFIVGEAANKSKDAREKTSGLVDLGLIDDNRRLTEVGNYLLNLTRNSKLCTDNILQISSDSFVYFKQLLKFTNKFDNVIVRPYIVLAYTLSKLNEISKDEFTYLLPLMITQEKLSNILESIVDIRNNQKTIDEVIISDLMSMKNYQEAYKLFLNNEVSVELIMQIGMNRKSGAYDKIYFDLYTCLWNLKQLISPKNVQMVFNTVDKINSKSKSFWKQYIFNTLSKKKIFEDGVSCINRNKALFKTQNEIDFKKEFFKLLHLFKAKSLLLDYYDLNERYLKTSNTILFQDNKVKFDAIPNSFFKIIGSNLLKLAFTDSENTIKKNCNLNEISEIFNVNNNQLFNATENLYGIQIKNPVNIKKFVEDLRYKRFNALLDNVFTKEKLIHLLDLFEKRDDDEIQKIITNNADIPTLFEYVVGIIWYEISERKGNILEYMNLSLDADLLPITHATGGYEDITYKYNATNDYPKHVLLIEATLSNGSNQRRMEMEPVSRHLGEYMLIHNDEFAYCIFISTFLHVNVVSDFRSRKIVPYYSSINSNKFVNGMEIIPLQTSELKKILQNNIHYSEIYHMFQLAFNSNLPANRWYENEIINKLNK